MKKNFDEIANFERAISKRWGKESIENPRKHWNEEKEEEFKKQAKELHEKELEHWDKETKVEQDGFFVTEKLFNRGNLFIDKCPVCNRQSRTAKDDVYILKWDCCTKCHVQWVEGREERWKSGWRPKNEHS